MSKVNILVSINSYEDANSSNNPNMNHFKWTRQVVNGAAEEPQSLQTIVHPGSPKSLFSGVIQLDQDGTTKYDLSFVQPGVYKLSHSGGTAPNFRTDRLIGGGSDTEVSVSVSGGAKTFAVIAGTPLDLTRVQLGDEVVISSPFSSLNKGVFKIISVSANSFTIESQFAAAETRIFGSDTPIMIQSKEGLLPTDQIQLGPEFGAASGIYSILSVLPNSLTFAFSGSLPALSGVSSQIVAFSRAKKTVYIESSKKVALTINGNQTVMMEPSFESSPAICLLTQKIYSLSVECVDFNSSTIYMASIE